MLQERVTLILEYGFYGVCTYFLRFYSWRIASENPGRRKVGRFSKHGTKANRSTFCCPNVESVFHRQPSNITTTTM